MQFVFGLLALFAIPMADAQKLNHGNGNELAQSGVELQPFTMDPSSPSPTRVVHAPSRALKAIAVEPMRLAFYAPRAQPVETLAALPKGESDREEQQEDERPIIGTRREGPTVGGNCALLRNGVAYAPSHAPANVKSAIWAVNSLRRKPYIWGGGHRSFDDRGYDCSGSVSYALHHAGLLGTPLPSNDLMRYGERGRGRWITIYARRGHTFAVIAGLRLDTTDLRNGGDTGPRWYADGRETRGFEIRHPTGM